MVNLNAFKVFLSHLLELLEHVDKQDWSAASEALANSKSTLPNVAGTKTTKGQEEALIGLHDTLFFTEQEVMYHSSCSGPLRCIPSFHGQD